MFFVPRRTILLFMLFSWSRHDSGFGFQSSFCRRRSQQSVVHKRSLPTKFHQLFVGSRTRIRIAIDAITTNNEEFGSHQQDNLWQKRSKRWVLLVDDEESIRKAVGQFLFDRGYQVTACADGPTALRTIFRRPPTTHDVENGSNPRPGLGLPDAIISDVRMPDMDGLELLRKIRENEQLVEIPVVLLTAKGMTKDRIEGYDAGADAYVPKPFDPEELITIVDSVIERHDELSRASVNIDDLRKDLEEMKFLLVERGGGGVGNGWIKATNVFLAPDEREVLELLCQGLMNKEIAQRTFYSRRRVEQLLTSMYRKANVKNRTELVRWAISTGYVQI